MVFFVTFGVLLRDLRQANHWSQGQLAERLRLQSGHASLTQAEISRWERGKTIPRAFWLDHIAEVFAVPVQTVYETASLARMNRRAFLSLSALTAAHGTAAIEMVASVAGADPIPLMTVQTTHDTDLVIASKVDAPVASRLRRWMLDGDNAILRVNATGILAKVPGMDTAREVATVLEGDQEARELYMTAVLARACAIEWALAAQLVADPFSMPHQASYFASRLATEVLNPRDAGARWCSAVMLRDLSPQL